MNIRQLFFLMCLSSFLYGMELDQSKQMNWIIPKEPIMTVYYQGMNSTQTQASKYMGNRGFVSPTTKEQVICTKSIDIIHDVWVKPEIDEVVLSPIKRDWNQLAKQPYELLKTAGQIPVEMIAKISNYYSGIQVTPSPDNSSHKTLAAHSLIFSKINIAQDGDMKNHKKRLKAFLREHPGMGVILMGVSRGAATTFQAAAKYYKKGKDLSFVKLITLEGCFDSVDHIMHQRHPLLLSNPTIETGMELAASKVIAYKKDGTAPIKVIDDFPPHIPVIFITSLKDKEVPPACTNELIKKLVKRNQNEIYYLVLKNSSHPRYMSDDAEDKETYQNFMHAIYEKYDLPYIPAYAAAGKNLIKKSQENAQLVAQI